MHRPDRMIEGTIAVVVIWVARTALGVYESWKASFRHGRVL